MPADAARPGAPSFAIAAILCLVIGVLGGLLAAEVESGPEAAQERFTPPREPARDFRLLDQDGRPTSLADARGRVVVLTFLYSSCWDLCPAQAGEIVRAVQKVGGDGVSVYGVSVDPVGDTPARVREWLARYGLTGQPVHFLIGSRRELAPVWRAYGIAPLGATPAEAAAAAEAAARIRRQPDYELPAEYDRPERGAPPGAREAYPDVTDLSFRGRSRHRAGLAFEHTAYVMLIDRRGEQRVGIPFEQLDHDRLAHDIRALLAEG